MSLAHTLQVFEALDSAHASGQTVVNLLAPYARHVKVSVNTLTGPKGSTDLVRMEIPGTAGKQAGGTAPTLGIVGRLGGVGARPARIGLVSDGDGAVAAIAAALKLAAMREHGDALPGDVVLSTHDRRRRVFGHMAAQNTGRARTHGVLLRHRHAKGNRILNHKGYAISPTVKEGYILRVADDLVRIMEMTSGRHAVTFPITTQDITPYGNGIYHLNSILQPATATRAPTVGVAICAQSVVPGCGTGASDEVDIAATVRFAVEVAKEFTRGTCRFYDEAEYARLIELYGSLAHLQQRR